MNTIEILQKTKEILMERGWFQGGLTHKNDTVCVLGSLNLAQYGTVFPVKDLTIGRVFMTPAAVALHKEAQTRGYRHAADFNDATYRTFNEVIDFIEATIISVKEENHNE